MYIKMYYEEGSQDKLVSLKAVDYNEKEVSLNLNEFIGNKVTDSLKKQVSNLLKGYFVTNWISLNK